ncbi:MAG: FtsX-like permease family protein, partial [Clostridia bacterium]
QPLIDFDNYLNKTFEDNFEYQKEQIYTNGNITYPNLNDYPITLNTFLNAERCNKLIIKGESYKNENNKIWITQNIYNALSNYLNLDINDSVSCQINNIDVDLIIAGVVSDYNCYIGIDYAVELGLKLRVPDFKIKSQSYDLDYKKIEKSKKHWTKDINAIFGKVEVEYSNDSYIEYYNNNKKNIGALLYLVIGVLFILIIVSIINTFNINFYENELYYNLLKVFGLSNLHIQIMNLIEFIIIGINSMLFSILLIYFSQPVLLRCLEWMWFDVFKNFVGYEIIFNMSFLMFFIVSLIYFIFIPLILFVFMREKKGESIIGEMREIG